MLESVLEEVQRAIEAASGDIVFFRGHSDASWFLLPGLSRRKTRPNIEAIMYYDFVTRAGDLLPVDDSGWIHLFAMQHHGIPTRLLDWTTTFGVALYFAVREGTGDAAVWVLDPFILNRTAWDSESLPSPRDLEANYFDSFISQQTRIPAQVVAISPVRYNPRIFNQRAAFTLHEDLNTPLENLYPDVVRKIVIPANKRNEARRFLQLAGISEYSLFPDLDGLARELLLENFR